MPSCSGSEEFCGECFRTLLELQEACWKNFRSLLPISQRRSRYLAGLVSKTISSTAFGT